MAANAESRNDAFLTISKSCQVLLLGCKWLVNLVVKEEDSSPAIENIIQNSSSTFAFVHSYLSKAEYNLPGQERLYYEIIGQTSQALKQHFISTFRIAVAINLSLRIGDTSLKNLHRQNLDEVIKLVVGAIRKLCYGVKRDPYGPVSMADPIQLVKNAVVQLRNWVDQFSDSTVNDIVHKPEWRKTFMEKKVDLVEAMVSLQGTLTHSAFDLNVEVHDFAALLKRSITLGDALTRNPHNSQCRKQVEGIVFEGLDLVRRVLPYLRREFSGVPENPSGALTYAEPIVPKDTEIPEPVIEEGDAGEDDSTVVPARGSFYDRLNLRVRSGSEPSVTGDNPQPVATAPLSTSSDNFTTTTTQTPIPIITAEEALPAASSAPTTSPLDQPQQTSVPSSNAEIRKNTKSPSSTNIRYMNIKRLDSVKKKPHSSIDLYRGDKKPISAMEEEQPVAPPSPKVAPLLTPPSPTMEAFTPPPSRYAFSEKKKQQPPVEEISSLELDTTPSFDDILGMLQDDNSRLMSEKEEETSTLQSLESGVMALQMAGATSFESPREGEPKVTTALSSYASVDSPQVLPSKEYVIEKNGSDSKRYTANFAIHLETPENCFGYYSEHFYGNEHWNYVGNVRDLGGAVAISITKFVDPSSRKHMAVIRTRTGDTRLLLNAKSPKLKDLYAALLHAIAPATVKSKNLTLISDPNLHNALLKFEKSQLLTCFKIAVLYVGPHQTKELEFYQNTKHSPDFEEFLNFLGDRVELKGWQGFRAGLDVKTSTTGTHSVFTKYMELSLMFHVSTFLPFSPLDEQQIERKRHLGNDIVMIVFQEGDQPFSPDEITSEFNQVFFIIRKIATEDGSTSYQISVASHDMISPFGPMIPDPPVFKKNAFFRRWLLTKLINSEAAAYAAPAIALKLNRARGELLDIIYKDYCHK